MLSFESGFIPSSYKFTAPEILPLVPTGGSSSLSQLQRLNVKSRVIEMIILNSFFGSFIGQNYGLFVIDF
jgi:hypothetical protein